MQINNTHTHALKRSYTPYSYTRHSKQSRHHRSSLPHSTRKKTRSETISMTLQVCEPQQSAHQKSSLCYRVFYTQLSKDRLYKTNLDNYERLIYPLEHIQNIRSLLELITQDIDVMCKVLLIALCEFAHVWYHSLEPSFILQFHDLSSNLISHFNTSIPVKNKKPPQNSSQSHSEKIKVLKPIFNISTNKCLMRKDSLNSQLQKL